MARSEVAVTILCQFSFAWTNAGACNRNSIYYHEVVRFRLSAGERAGVRAGIHPTYFSDR